MPISAASFFLTASDRMTFPGCILRTLIFASVLVIATACGGGIDGTYADPTGMMKLEFRSGGEVRQSMMGTTVAGTYETDGEEVIVDVSGQRMVFRREDDRLINGGVVLTRRDE
jgi:hypothetical protein